MRVIKLEDSDLATMTSINKKTGEVKVHLTFEDTTKNTVLEMNEKTLFGLANSFNKICLEFLKHKKGEE